jgi:hypothetical protein
LLLDITLQNNSRYINLGDWFKKPHCAAFDGVSLQLKAVD